MDRTHTITHPIIPSGSDGRPAPGRDASDLVKRAQAGDSAAFAALYEEYAPTIYRFLRRRLAGPDELVADLTADVFVKAYEKLDRFQERGLPYSAWLYRIAHNQMIDHLRKHRRPACPLDEASQVPEHTPEVATARVLDRQVLEPALVRLTDEQRAVVELRFLSGFSVAQTATLIGRSEEAIKKLQVRGLVNLRRLLGPLSPAQPAGAVGRAASAAA